MFAVLGWLGALWGLRTGGRRPRLAPVLASLLGVGVGWVVRPGGVGYGRLALGHVLGDFGGPRSAMEMFPAPPSLFLEQAGPCLLLLLLAGLWGWRRSRYGSSATRAAALLAVLASLAMTLFAFRFIDYLVPFAVVATALHWPRQAALPARLRIPALAAAALLGAASVARNLVLGWSLGSSVFDPPATFDQLAAAVRAQVPPGALVFSTEAFVTDVLVAALPEYSWPVAYDHVLLQLADPERFWAWEHFSREAVDCRAPRCPPTSPRGPAAAEGVLGLFDSRWLLTRGHGDAALEQALAEGAGEQLAPVAQVPAPVSGHWTLWRLQGSEGQRR
jgi:hypothetical protein